MAYIDFDDVAYEDSVSSDTGFAFDGEPVMTWEEDPSQWADFPEPSDYRDYELLDACDCAAEMLGECYD